MSRAAQFAARMLTVGLVVLAFPGCVGPELAARAGISLAETGTSTFVQGSQRTVYARPFDDVVAAARAMVADFDLTPRRETVEDGYVYLLVTDQSESDVMIRVRRKTARLASISIRVGLLGDEPMSAVLMKGVDARLAASGHTGGAP